MKPKLIKEIDRIVDSSLRQLAADKHVHAWCAKERDWVNYFASPLFDQGMLINWTAQSQNKS